MIYVLVPIYVLICIFLILVVLLQQGKGADVASAFGASSSQTTFGARGATTVLERITTWSFVAFSILAIAISIVQARPHSSVLAGRGAKKAAASAPKAAVPSTAPAGAAPAPMTSGEAPAPATSAPATK